MTQTTLEQVNGLMTALARNIVDELRLHDDNYGDAYYNNLIFAITEYGNARAALAIESRKEEMCHTTS